MTKNRSFYLRLIVWPDLLWLVLGHARCSPATKRCVGLIDHCMRGDRIKALNVAWYYTWKLQPIEGVAREHSCP